MTGREDYHERQERRRERLEARAERLGAESNRQYRKADLREEVSGIPLGQPILVGHHSERRHRRAIEKADNAMRRSIDLGKRAGEAAAAAASVGTAGISSDNPDAIEELTAKLAELEAIQEFMRAANRVIRKHHKAGVRHDSDPETIAAYLNAMKALKPGFPDAAARKLLEPDFARRIGFADYQLTNNGANIRRVKARIADLQRQAIRETAETLHNSGVRAVQNVEANRMQLFFPGKPDAEVRALLKSHGFRWAPSEGAWQRHLNNAGIWAAKTILASLVED